jgi:sugar lactone lactonase YvrE
MIADVFLDIPHELGEGPLWHDERGELFWCSILAGELNVCDGAGNNHRIFPFGEAVSAAAIVDRRTLVIATASGLKRFDIDSGAREALCAFPQARTPVRSNDGRAGPGGAFWIGTMSRSADPAAGSLYRFAGGVLGEKRHGMSIPNAICFSPKGDWAYFSDTPEQSIMRWRLDPDSGDTIGEPQVFIDLRSENLMPDGAVTDDEGCIWNAQWGAGRVARYDPNGRFVDAVTVPAAQVTCPAFGGTDMKTLFVTSAWQGMNAAARRIEPRAGAVFAVEVPVAGRPEHRVDLARS